MLNFTKGSSNRLYIADIRQTLTGAALDSITSVEAELLDKDKVAIAGSSITLGLVAGETDTYRGLFPSTLTVTAGATGYVRVHVIGLVGAVTHDVTRDTRCMFVEAVEPVTLRYLAGSANVIQLSDIRDSLGAPLASIGLVVALLVDSAGASITGSTIVLAAVAGEQARRGAWGHTVPVTAGTSGKVEVRLAGNDGDSITVARSIPVKYEQGEAA